MKAPELSFSDSTLSIQSSNHFPWLAWNFDTIFASGKEEYISMGLIRYESTSASVSIAFNCKINRALNAPETAKTITRQAFYLIRYWKIIIVYSFPLIGFKVLFLNFVSCFVDLFFGGNDVQGNLWMWFWDKWGLDKFYKVFFCKDCGWNVMYHFICKWKHLDYC